MKDVDAAVAARTSSQYGLITAEQARRCGLNGHQIAYRTRTGRWIRLHPGVYAVAGVAPSSHSALLAACLAAGSAGSAREPVAASHLSAAWLLGLVRRPPPGPAITIGIGRRERLGGVTVHRSSDLDPARIIRIQGIPCTDGLRCMCDLAAILPPRHLQPIVDRALARGMLTTEGLLEEVRRRQASGRRGPGQLRATLDSRGLVTGPEPSVLEADAMRLFRRFGIPVLDREVRMGSDGRYKIDFLIELGLVVEVDGYAYHWSPEAKAGDEDRRNRLHLEGVMVLVYTWRDIRSEGARVASQVNAARRMRAAGRAV